MPIVNSNNTKTLQNIVISILFVENPLVLIYFNQDPMASLTCQQNSKKAVDYEIVGIQNTYCFLDDNIILSTGSESDHVIYVTKCLKKLDEDN